MKHHWAKPVGQDDLHGRPSAVTELGVKGAFERLSDTLSGAIASIPSCPGEAALAEGRALEGAIDHAKSTRQKPSLTGYAVGRAHTPFPSVSVLVVCASCCAVWIPEMGQPHADWQNGCATGWRGDI